MDRLAVELPTTKEDWASFDGHTLDDKVGELNAAQRRIEASIVGATGTSIAPVTTRSTVTVRCRAG